MHVKCVSKVSVNDKKKKAAERIHQKRWYFVIAHDSIAMSLVIIFRRKDRQPILTAILEISIISPYVCLEAREMLILCYYP
jgi:hypothetical protein